MKTSLDLPDDLYRRVKAKSALEGRAVREVATELFTAWVEGRVPARTSDHPAADALPEPADPRSHWLAQWNALTARVAEAAGEGPGLVEQLRRDRR